MAQTDFRELELKLLTVSVRSSAARLDARLSDDFREFGRSGRVYSRAETIAALLEHPAVPGGEVGPNDLLDFRADVVSPTVALVTYRFRASLRSSLWRFEGDAWRLFFHQGTPADELATVTG